MVSVSRILQADLDGRLRKSGGGTFSSAALCLRGLHRWFPSIAGAFLIPGAARAAQQCGEKCYRCGVFDPLGQSLPQSRAACSLRASLAYRHSFFCAQRGARRPPHIPPLVLMGPHPFRFLCLTGVSRGLSPPRATRRAVSPPFAVSCSGRCHGKRRGFSPAISR
jgi:hypothetical protein